MVRVVFNQIIGGQSSFQSEGVVRVVLNQSVGGHSSFQSECWWLE